MNFNPQDVASTKSQTIGASILQIEDLNNLIDSLKRREENIIQLLDYNLKYKNSSNHMDTIHLRGLYLQLHEREKKRIEQEELIIQKYTDLYVSDEYQKKLMNKMRNKILQLSSSARDKLLQLGIFQQTKDAFLGISNFEDALTAVLSKMPVDVHFFLSCLIENSRKRFINEIDSESVPCLEFNKPRALEMNSGFNKAELNLSKVALQKGFSPLSSAKVGEELKPRESVRIRNVESNMLSRKELAKIGRSPLTVKSVDSRPSFDFKEYSKNSYDLPDKKRNIPNPKETTRPAELDLINETVCEQVSPAKETPNKEVNIKQEVLAITFNANNQNVSTEKVGTVIQNISSRISNVKKIKISSNNNKKSVCLEETSEFKGEKEKEKKEEKPNKEAWLKNYDILKIEYQPLPTATKKETKKLLLEKVYNQLLGTNSDIKKTIKRYKGSYLSYIQKKQSESDSNKEETSNANSQESNRPKSLTPQSYNNSTPSKPKPSPFNPNQRSLFYMENIKEAEDVDASSDNFLNILSPFIPSSVSMSSKYNKDNIKKQQSSQKFLVLPKLNLYPETQSQGVFPCWPPSLQGSKSAVKSNFTLDFVNRPRYEKCQKGSERIGHHLMLDTKQDMSEQETLNTSLMTQPLGNRAYSNFSNKNSYPLTLQPLESVSTINKPIAL